MMTSLPGAVTKGLRDCSGPPRILDEERIDAGTGAATGDLTRLRIELPGDQGERRIITLVRKRLRPLAPSRHVEGATDPRHWAYWRREAEAYSSGLLPPGPGLRAPRCVAIVGDELYLEDATGSMPRVSRAAQLLAAWQVAYAPALDRPWLSVDQLGRRLAASSLDWDAVSADPRMAALWDHRVELFELLQTLPKVLSHGDYSVGNLVDDTSDVVALDWATVGWEPIGFDLGHLALSSGEDPIAAYLQPLPASGIDPELAVMGFRATVALVGASRMHWMLSRGVVPPDWYAEFVWNHRPAAVRK